MRNIRNVDPKLPLPIPRALQADRVVEIFRVIRINGDHLMFAAVHAPGNLLRFNFLSHRTGLVQHLFGKVQ